MIYSFKRFLSGLLSTALVFSPLAANPAVIAANTIEIAGIPTTNRDDAPEDVKTAVSHLICAYGNADPEGAASYLEQIKTLSPDEWYPVYSDVLDEWNLIENEMQENIGVIPDGLEDPAHHCIITLGFALNADGTMTDELIGRLEVTLASLEKYPESKVLVTGGVEKNGWTEGQRMHDWLIDHGIAEDRIFVEKKAPDTAGNAANSFEILYNDGTIKTVSLISSSYHVKRGSILYYTESLLKAKELGVEPITFLTSMNAGWLREDKLSEPLATKANSMYTICRVPKLEMPDLSQTELTGLDVIFPDGSTFLQGQPLECIVKTLDTKFENLTVTEFCVFTGYDPNKIGEQKVTCSFTYNGKTVSADFTVTVVQPEYKKALSEAIEKVDSLEQSINSKADWDAFQAALGQAKAKLADPAASEEDCTAALNALNEAVKPLQMEMYRLYNPNSGEHFYTSSVKERDYLGRMGWKKEGNAWVSPAFSDVPVFRLYNPNQGDHHYTTYANERDYLVKAGWEDEDVAWYSEAAKSTPIYRLYNPNATTGGAHHFTANKAESDYLAKAGWRYEGIAMYSK